jgi:four helix bundle protein
MEPLLHDFGMLMSDPRIREREGSHCTSGARLCSIQQSALSRTGAVMKDFRDLQVWRKAHELTLNSYRATASFPREELYGLTSQIRRCAASVAANIAEGCGKRGNAEFQRFLTIAAGSASELEYHFLLAKDLMYMNREQYGILDEATTEVKRMLASLIRKVETDRFSAPL